MNRLTITKKKQIPTEESGFYIQIGAYSYCNQCNMLLFCNIHIYIFGSTECATIGKYYTILNHNIIFNTQPLNIDIGLDAGARNTFLFLNIYLMCSSIFDVAAADVGVTLS